MLTGRADTFVKQTSWVWDSSLKAELRCNSPMFSEQTQSGKGRAE